MTPENLKIDIRSKHENIKFTCLQCDYKTTTKRNLELHVQSKHGNIKYFCQECDYKTTA